MDKWISVKDRRRKPMKPILFNTDMVRAILEGRKSVTRRVVKPQPRAIYHDGTIYEDDGYYVIAENQNGALEQIGLPYRPGDTLYVRETWAPMYPDETSKIVCGYMYKADDCGLRGEEYQKWYDAHYPNGKDWYWPGIWRPSIHMPKEAARLLLRVTAVRVERLREINCEQAYKEGCTKPIRFDELWNSTIKPADLPLYSWDANPWVWVIEFERISREEALEGGGNNA